MYTRQEASQMRKKFWTGFGQYMRPVHSASGETVNWLNYNTGIKHIYFRLDADKQSAAVSIELHHPDLLIQQYYFEHLQSLKNVLEQELGEKWDWQLHITDEDGKTISRVSTKISGVSIFNESDWPAIISFFKPRMIALDQFWDMVKESFDQ